ncbi:MAG: GFA family protein [gamma proteobacterium symbiont of Bathyaustriella thionipta]|nr:GFA family protein [gamma proteobacterium symbiont of Bathyaustriella thionipta]MCU7950494.1 GFA family protein [gamma proteobacterium symbiont of Bathyaustriella thionipta]MCU7954854.1 GFA family protein [gamma proteobacterium symbiont of Bathyaustriella thionipta]MCU7958134.1 GFA family protein [gamma proteobacterium symbiont of Bathyaustriella thionipta]MCU7967923.1 GFA family protein [gamma proteobacterium symbiont of Bathyaustriella thionipta]
MSGEYFATGHCLCGAVNYTISAAPVRMGQCHCDDCRRTSGTGHASNAFFNKKHVRIEGETSHYDSTTDTGSIITRHFCPKCGSRLFGENNAAANIIAVTAGTLDESHWFKANAIVYNKRKPMWDIMDENIPTFEEMPAPLEK